MFTLLPPPTPACPPFSPPLWPPAASDVLRGAPSWGHDALYGGLALLLGFTAWGERQALIDAREEMLKGTGRGGGNGKSGRKGQ